MEPDNGVDTLNFGRGDSTSVVMPDGDNLTCDRIDVETWAGGYLLRFHGGTGPDEGRVFAIDLNGTAATFLVEQLRKRLDEDPE